MRTRRDLLLWLLQEKMPLINIVGTKTKDFILTMITLSHFQKKSFTLAAAFPLFFNIASPAQAGKIAQNLELHFLKSGGLISTTETTFQQWDAPNGWAPLQWIAIAGLRNYGHDELAKEIAGRWMDINEKVYHETGKMMEKYNVVATDTNGRRWRVSCPGWFRLD